MTLSLPQPLIEDIVDGKCLPFVGAGFSLNADCDEGYAMPDWTGLASQLARLAGVAEDIDGPDAAAAYERKFGRVQLIEAVRRSLNPEHVSPGRAHQTFVKLPFDTIYTTNFDLLLEDALSAIKRPFRSLVGESQLPFHAGLFAASVVKMHGDIRHEEHFVITRSDYEKFLTTYPVVATHLSAMLIVRTPLFLGYSRTDSNFQQIQSVIESRLGRFQRMPYVIQFDATADEVEQGLDHNIHVLSVSTENGNISRSDALADLFGAIQKEIDARAGKKLRSSDPEAFRVIPPTTLNQIYRANDSVDLLESSSSLCFVMMPLTREMDPVYWRLIKPAVEEVGLTPLRADEIHESGMITEQILAAIRESRVCIADMTTQNPNVLYEIGRAQAIGKPILFVARNADQIPFDIAHMRTVIYGSSNDSFSQAHDFIVSQLRTLLEGDKLQEAKALLSNGMYRAAVAIMGVILEHTLQNVVRQTGVPIRSQTHFSSMQMANALLRERLIDNELFNLVQQFAGIRNKAVHQLNEPSAQEASLALSLLENVIESLKGLLGPS
jgi:hypothetical protein